MFDVERPPVQRQCRDILDNGLDDAALRGLFLQARINDHSFFVLFVRRPKTNKMVQDTVLLKQQLDFGCQRATAHLGQ